MSKAEDVQDKTASTTMMDQKIFLCHKDLLW